MVLKDVLMHVCDGDIMSKGNSNGYTDASNIIIVKRCGNERRGIFSGREGSSLEERDLLWKKEIFSGRKGSSLEERDLLWKKEIFSGREGSSLE